jgi:hypothetical protein
VEPDWTDLEQTVEWLQAHPAIAEGIARRQRQMVVDAGYLSPASETCYWRSLIKAWSSVARIDEDVWGRWDDEGPKKGEGVRWETYSLRDKPNWD